jgi:glycerophosphoryl diester phosphodiesterase
MKRDSPRPWIIAHRGASRDRPENTIAAFDEALRQGADGIELDVQLSRDEVPVVYHDRTLVRAGGGRRRVAALEYDALRRLDAAHRFGGPSRREQIPSLEEVLGRYGGRTRLLVEIKSREGPNRPERHLLLARTVAGMVSQTGLGDRVMVLSFDQGVLDACGARAPHLPRVLNVRPPRRLTPALALRLRGLFALSVDIRSLTPGFAAAVDRANRPLLTYTCNTRSSVKRALEAGARGVISDRPGWLNETLRSLNEA